MDTFKILQTLTEAAGPSGYEQEIAKVVQAIWEPYVDSFESDTVGNLVAVKSGRGQEPRRRLMLAAHMDEIALMVSQIESYGEYGFLRVTNVGGVDIRHLYGQLVTVHGRRALPGILGSLPEFMQPTDRQGIPFGYEELVVDVGLPLAEVEAQVNIGDFISFRQPLRKLLGNRVAGKALDNRASVTAVAACLSYLTGRAHEWDVVAVATAQEETRLLGAFTSGYAQRPDIAIAIDVTFGKGPGANGPETSELGEGPVVDLGPNVHPGMYKALMNTAESLEMKVNTGVHSRASGTDAFGLQVAREGIPTAVLSIPLRYMHTMVESVDLTDIERCGRLLGEFVARLDDQFMDKLAAGLLGENQSQGEKAP